MSKVTDRSAKKSNIGREVKKSVSACRDQRFNSRLLQGVVSSSKTYPALPESTQLNSEHQMEKPL